MFFSITLATLCIMLTSLVGGVFSRNKVGAWLARRLRFCVALAVGVFSVVIIGLLREASAEGFSFALVSAFLFGGVLLEGVTRLLPKETHHHHSIETGHTHSPIDARRMLVGDAIHNIHDGLTLVPAFLVSLIVGFSTAFGILLHELVQGIAKFFILREAGYSVRKALFWNGVTATTIIIGVLIASIIASVDSFAPFLIAFSAGGFSYILFRDLLPSIVYHARAEKNSLPYLSMIALGVLLMSVITFFAPQ